MIQDNKKKNNALFLSMLLCMNNTKNHEISLQDARYLYCQKVSDCQIKMYSLVIECINNGMSYEEIEHFIDKLDIEEFRKLNEEEKGYVKTKIKCDLHTRKLNEQKNS